MIARQRPAISIISAIADAVLFAPWFRNRETWQAWFAFLKALFALSMSASELDTYRQCTGRDSPPEKVTEGWLICGRRAGKSFILALIAVFLSVFRDYSPFLAPGERATIVVIAADRKQARIIFRYAKALLSVPMLAHLIQRETQEGLDLTNRVTIEVHTASFRKTRGYAIAAALLDELAFWPTDDAAEPDHEIIAALKPGMATIPHALMLCGSSPYARRGTVYQAFERHYGKDGPVLVWKAPTRRMNPTVAQSVIDEAYEADPASAAAEYGAEFRCDLEAFVSRDVVNSCTDLGVHERAPISNVQYAAFCDPSGGSGADSMTLAIGHREVDTAFVDAIRETRPPFSPSSCVRHFANLLKQYRITKVTGDRYAGEWPREQFREHGIVYECSQHPASDLYQDSLPLLNSGRVRLLDHARLNAQLTNLERRTSRVGRDSITHPPNGHDDIANACAGMLVTVGNVRRPIRVGASALAKAKQQPPAHIYPSYYATRRA